MKRPMIVASAAALLLASATAVTAAQTLIEVEDDTTQVEAFGKTVDQVEDMDVIGADGETIGEVEDVLATPDGEVSALSVDVGGYFGIGEREVILGMDDVEFKDNKLSTTLTKDEIEKLPDWKDKS
ncbi:PRC-barrel domain protein [Methyloligella halotolerans]|uniref:PRC-barrel domain protein n=1 Tax=Methyloligella halotolerans TaxID=1177755 RepID=A0A1E2S172_9HYPH|nr:PRC-barrel domain-containing protein [Methyloligella halotolerans]ODA68253.1 PRC-barrel domain protein [Methyloligella halotolerans]